MDILIVDDDPFVPKLLGLQLRNFRLKERGFEQVHACTDAAQALRELELHPEIGLLFCDLQMPGIDGIELVRRLVERDYGGGLVLISGEDERVLQSAERLARAQHLRVLGALRKPVQPPQLQTVLDRVMQQFDPQRAVPSKRYPVEALRCALQRGELVNYYQPKIELRSGRVLGVETLVRWRHPEDGLVLPDQFIAGAEQDGTIDELCNYVLAEALTRARHWHDSGFELHVAVNISVANLSSLEFPDRVARAAARAGVALDRLLLELTESQLAQDLTRQIDIMTRLRLKHVGLSIDDFGTGYSSLQQLRELPFNELKLDQCFVHGAAADPALAAIVRSHLDLAATLRLDSCAEGVEDVDDWNFLLAAGCHSAQGYFVSPPLPAPRFDDWLRQWPQQRSRLPEYAS